ncbi:MFS transporter [Luteimicrobium xylanilyticum]|uniref:Aspartate--tRNA ligase n=1 Tax=Luteimicrobium xylanilyticum TaxID=1133546 RepID=A0A5P9QA35_9MICO|nr:MFS transporter [Luteimicrobium xylanilyticum]QFU98116.1 Aspartate--tRNA ligase [Luteimicrobium xylanilyticum]
MGLRAYREVLREPQLRRLIAVAMVARIPNSAAALVLTLHVVQTLHRSYAEAGIVATAATVGMALGSPWRGRLVDRVGLRRAVWPSVVAELVLWPLAGVVPFGVLIPLVFVGGLLALPTFTVVRKSISVLAPEGQQRTAYALDSIATELVFMVGPAVGVAVAAHVGTTAVLATIGVAVSGAGVLLLVFDPPTRAEQVVGRTPSPPAAPLTPAAPANGPTRRLAWLTPSVAAVLAASAGATIVLVGTDLAILARLRTDGQVGALGVVYFAWCLGSVVGGLAYGSRHRPTSSMLLLLALGALTVPMALAHSVVGLTLLAFLAGLPCAPVMTATAEEVARMVPEERRGEAMGWQGTAFTVGSAVGSPLVGLVIDAAAPWVAFVTAGGAGALIAVVGLAVRRARRDADPQGELRL